MLRIPTILATAATLVLGACTAGPLPPPPPYASGRPKAELVAIGHRVAFVAGEDRIGPVQRLRLDRFLRDMALDGRDHIHVVAAGNDALSIRRAAAVGAFLATLGIEVEEPVRALDGIVEADGVAVVVERGVVTVPVCGTFRAEDPWRQAANLPAPNFGCATARNLALQVADPRDLVIGRPEGPALGDTAARAVEAYRAGKTKPLVDPNAAPIGQGAEK